jgi:archaeal flagellar protein FlaJ
MGEKKSNLNSKLTQLGRYLISSKRKSSIRTLFIKAGYDDIPYEGIAISFIGSIFLSIFWYIYLILASQIKEYGILFIITTSILFIIIFEIILLIVLIVIIRIFLSVKKYNRVQSIEQNLPLFLRELSTNLRAGREFVDALEDTLTPELGIFNEDIKKILVEIKSGKMIEKVLLNYSKKYDSYAINETFEIILESYHGGGGLSEIIDKIAENLEVIHFLKKNAIASVANYIVFTTIVSLLIAPILFALSYNLLELVSTLLKRLVVSGAQSSYLDVGGRLDISFTDFKFYSQLGVGIIAGSAASIIGIIKRGSLKGAPILILTYVSLSILIYNLALFFLKHAFEVLFTL